MSVADRLRVIGPAAAVLGYVGAVLCLVVGLLLLAAPRPEPVPLQGGTAAVPGAAFLHPGTAVLVPAGTSEDVVAGLGCEATNADGAAVGRFFQGLPRESALPDGTAVAEVLTASGVRGGDTVTCSGASTDVWLAQDGSARTTGGVAALVLAPVMLVGATILLLVGLAARRRT